MEEIPLIDKDGTRTYAGKCPFCSNRFLKMQTIPDSKIPHFVVCINCGGAGPRAKTKSKAIDMWNKRGEENESEAIY